MMTWNTPLIRFWLHFPVISAMLWRQTDIQPLDPKYGAEGKTQLRSALHHHLLGDGACESCTRVLPLTNPRHYLFTFNYTTRRLYSALPDSHANGYPSVLSLSNHKFHLNDNPVLHVVSCNSNMLLRAFQACFHEPREPKHQAS